MSTLVVRYSCPDCELFDVPVDVPVRRDDPVTAWVEATIRLLVIDHKRRSPTCRPETLEDVHIPLLRHGILLPDYRAALLRAQKELRETA